jgi:hypothetical protein
MDIPRSTTVYLNKSQNDKLRTISFEMKLNKDSLVNFWLSRGLKHRKPSEFKSSELYQNSFTLLNEIKSELQKVSFKENMQLSHLASCYLKDAIDETHDFLTSHLHTATFQKLVHHFEDTTEISKWPNVAFRNLRNIPKEPAKKSKNKIYVIVDRRAHWDGNGGESIDSIYTSLALATSRLKDLQRGKEIHNFYGPHIDSYEENGSLDKCCMDIKKS